MKTGVKIAIIGGSAITVFLIGRYLVYPPIMRGIIRKDLDKQFDDAGSESAAGGLDKFAVSETFDPDRYQSADSKASITLMEARERAKLIWENYGWFSSNQTAIISAFNNLGHQDDVSKIAHEFYALYSEELLTVLKEALTDKAQYNLLIAKIQKLPKD